MSELLTVAQVAFVLKCSEDTVVRRFEKRTGVIDLGTANNGRRNRRYRVLRIPKTVVEKYLVERSGSAVKIEVPPRRKQNKSYDAAHTKAVQQSAFVAASRKIDPPNCLRWTAMETSRRWIRPAS